MNIMHLIGFIIFGFIVGLIARALMPGQQHMSLLKTTALGILGALLAGVFGRLVGWYGPDDNAGFISSTVGAIIVLVLYHSIARRRHSSLGSDTSKNFPNKAA